MYFYFSLLFVVFSLFPSSSLMRLICNLFLIFKEHSKKPKKKKEEANSTTEAKLNGKEAKPKKTKSKKSEDVSEEDNPTIQSEQLCFFCKLSYFVAHTSDLIKIFLSIILQCHRWKKGEEKETRKRQGGSRER